MLSTNCAYAKSWSLAVFNNVWFSLSYLVSLSLFLSANAKSSANSAWVAGKRSLISSKIESVYSAIFKLISSFSKSLAFFSNIFLSFTNCKISLDFWTSAFDLLKSWVIISMSFSFLTFSSTNFCFKSKLFFKLVIYSSIKICKLAFSFSNFLIYSK